MESQSLSSRIAEATFDPSLEPDPFTQLDEILDLAAEAELLPQVIRETAAPTDKGGVDPARSYLLAGAFYRLGDNNGAWKAAQALAGKLEQGEHWRALASLCSQVLEYSPRPEAALHIAKAFESAGFEFLDPALLRRAYELFPDEARLSYLMGELKAVEAGSLGGGADDPGHTQLMDEARTFWAEALDGFVLLKRQPQIEEALLKIADSEDPRILKHILDAVRKLGQQGQWGRMDAVIEIALPSLRKASLIGDLWHLILKLLPDAPAGVNLRKHLSGLANEAFSEVDGIMDLLNRSGILDSEVKVSTAMKNLEPLLAFAPGYHVLHASWGIGRIRLNDGETLILDFQDTNNHRMSVNLARRALQVVPSDDLRVVKVQDPSSLKRRIKDDPAEVAYLGIRQLGGTATTQTLKRTLVGNGILTASQWTTFWKAAREAMEADSRFDLSQAFRQTYLISNAEAEGGVALPPIEPRRGVRPNLNLIRRFLDQHPDQTARAAALYGGILRRWLRDERTSVEESMAIHLQLHRWTRQVDEDFVETLAAMLHEGIEAAVFTGAEDQKLIVEVGLSKEKLWREAVAFALSSRYPEIRSLAMERLRQDPAGGREILESVLRNPALRPQATLAVVSLALGRAGQRESFAPDLWDAATAVAHLAESTSREPIRKQALSLLGPSSALAEAMLRVQPTDSQLDRMGILIQRWRSSERFLQPLLGILRQAGHDDMVRELREQRMARTNQMLSAQPVEDFLDLPGQLMTRMTFERLKSEMERLNYELKTTVAEAIAKARAMGDLSENAEYDAARMKQADFSERVASLALRLENARMIEDLKIPDGRVAPGTEVVVEDLRDGSTRRFWILGEGDDQLADGVISYTSPLGRALLGTTLDGQVRLPAGDLVHEYAVRQIRRRMPDASMVSGGKD